MRKLKKNKDYKSKYEQITKSYKKSSPYYYRRYVFQESGFSVHRKEPRDVYYFYICFFLTFGIITLGVSIYIITTQSENNLNQINRILGMLSFGIYSLTVGILLILILLYYYFTRYKKKRKITIELFGFIIVIINFIIIAIWAYILWQSYYS